MTNPTTAPRFSVDYLIHADNRERAHQIAADITLEQTVEVPLEVVPAAHHAAGLLGRLESLTAAGQGWLARISYRCDLTGFTVPQLFNVLFGNISLKNNIRIVELQFPEAMNALLGGPRYGINGVRRLLGVHGRPLSCTAIKPMGLPTVELARIAGCFAAGGADLIKDDHGLADQPFHPFAERVGRCQEAISAANASSGRNTLYFPMLSGGIDQLESQVRIAVREGVRGIMVGPMLVGLDAMRHIAAQYDLVVMAHPALTGTFFHDRRHGISPAVLLGTLFRLLGADISIYPHAGGRFHFSNDECRELASHLRRPVAGIKPAFPCPAGGMKLERIPELVQFYGEESILLIGGDVLRQPDVEAATRQFMDGLRACGKEVLSLPQTAPLSSCDWQAGSTESGPVELLRCENFHWQGRKREDYKQAGSADFAGIVRQELTGKFGEETAFDLRYFEIAPGGWSSLEKHVHEHVIIGVRGSGALIKGERELVINVHDIAYVRPLEVHQLRNRGNEPFGFFCIVDHKRDRPQLLDPKHD